MDIIIDKILQDWEIKTLSEIIKSRDEYEQIMEEIKKGNICALGAWNSSRKILLGVLLLKEEINNTVTGKIIIPHQSLDSEALKSIYHGLVKKAEYYISKEGYDTFLIRANVNDKNCIKCLIDLDFIITGYINKKNPKDDIYILEKRLHPIYSHDPYDLELITNWILERIFQLTGIEKRNKRLWTGRYRISSQEDLYVTINVCAIFNPNDYEEFFDDFCKCHVILNFIEMGKTIVNPEKCLILDIGLKQIRKITRNPSISPRLESSSGLMRNKSLAVKIRESIFKRYLDKSKRGVKEFIYIDGGIYGRKISRNAGIVFISQESNSVLGYARKIKKIEYLNTQNLKAILQKDPNIQQKLAFSKEELFKYLALKKEVTVITFENLHRLDRDIDADLLPVKWAEGKTWGYIDFNVFYNAFVRT